MTAPTSTATPSLADASWLTCNAAQAVFRALSKAGYEARAVGGAVRNTLLGLPVKDVDIATPALPDQVVIAAQAAGLKTIATGLKHGTVTLISSSVPFEVTTLRRDEETDGRHATVAFTADWNLDASRRDFTINALYCDADGTLFDPLGGYADLVAGRVRFIGSAPDRIREDYLRVLRFFRFTSDYATGAPDPAGLAACAEMKDGIARLSGERLRAEMLRIVMTKRAGDIVRAMDDIGLLRLVLGLDGRPDRLQSVIRCEAASGSSPDDVLRLGAVALSKPGDALMLRRHLRLSNDEYQRLSRMSMPDHAFNPSSDERVAKAFIYRHGARAFRDGVLMAWSAASDASSPERIERLNLTQRWRAPVMPVDGTDVMALGIDGGPVVGQVLSAFEDWWIAADFPLDPQTLAASLAEIVNANKA
jgi:poly(A) polymerase